MREESAYMLEMKVGRYRIELKPEQVWRRLVRRAQLEGLMKAFKKW